MSVSDDSKRDSRVALSPLRTAAKRGPSISSSSSFHASTHERSGGPAGRKPLQTAHSPD